MCLQQRAPGQQGPSHEKGWGAVSCLGPCTSPLATHGDGGMVTHGWLHSLVTSASRGGAGTGSSECGAWQRVAFALLHGTHAGRLQAGLAPLGSRVGLWVRELPFHDGARTAPVTGSVPRPSRGRGLTVLVQPEGPAQQGRCGVSLLWDGRLKHEL